MVKIVRIVLGGSKSMAIVNGSCYHNDTVTAYSIETKQNENTNDNDGSVYPELGFEIAKHLFDLQVNAEQEELIIAT